VLLCHLFFGSFVRATFVPRLARFQRPPASPSRATEAARSAGKVLENEAKIARLQGKAPTGVEPVYQVLQTCA
jgi:hypothetical protein